MKEQKKQLRRQQKEKRMQLLPDFCRQADRQIYHRLAALAAFQQAKTVFCFVPLPDEINLQPLLEETLQSGKRLAVPLCTGQGVMEAREIKSLTELREGAYGIPEPSETAPVICPDEIDFAVIPGVCFDRSGGRLGRGCGYYDRYLPMLVCPKFGISYECLMADCLPLEEWDFPVDGVVTELTMHMRKKESPVQETAAPPQSRKEKRAAEKAEQKAEKQKQAEKKQQEAALQKGQGTLGILLAMLMLTGFLFAFVLWNIVGKAIVIRSGQGDEPQIPQPLPPYTEEEEDSSFSEEQQEELEKRKKEWEAALEKTDGSVYRKGTYDDSFRLQKLPEGEALTIEEIAAKVKPSVTGVLCYQKDGMLYSEGSGVIMTEDGYLITNMHVVHDAEYIEVMLDSSRVYPAALVGGDYRSDLAILKIDETNLPAAEFGDSDSIVIGSTAVAIGNPNGFHNSVTSGIFSGLNRTIEMKMDDGNKYSFTLIQIDAAINPGNSGGVVANKYGQVVGISSSKISSVDFEGMGFAISTRLARPVVEDLLAFGEVKSRARMGVIAAPMLKRPPEAHAPYAGVELVEIFDDSCLSRKSVYAGDIVVSAENKPMRTASDLVAVVESHHAGETISMEIYQIHTDSVRTVTVTLGEAK